MIRDVNRAMLDANKRSVIKQMIKAFELCYQSGLRRDWESQYICSRLDDLEAKGKISVMTHNACQRLVMNALGTRSTLNGWWHARLSESKRKRLWPMDMPRHYRQLWLKQIIKDLRWLLK